MAENLLRSIPQIQGLLETDSAVKLCNQYSRQETVSAIRAHLELIRNQIHSKAITELPDFNNEEFFEDIHQIILHGRERSLKQVINATGIILHTNMGRAPLAEEAFDHIKETAFGYSNLELDITTGKRGSRYMHVESILRKITDAEAAVVVNNCAAAVLVSLNTLAKDGEVIVSRGELIEIGGGFRMPDVITASGAILKEVGTTNKTRLADFENAINENSKVILRNHCSNYKIVGFTESPNTKELAELAHSKNLLMIEDLGSGALLNMAKYGINNEHSVQQLLNDGVDVVTFSGDKLLGGPQAGIILGRENTIAAIKKNPLLRALRIDKLSLAALEATLSLYLDQDLATQRIPILKMITEDLSFIKKKANSLLKFISNLDTDNLNARVEDSTSYVGGGSAPMNELPTSIIKLSSNKLTPEKIATQLRNHKPPIIGRISDDCFVIDLRTVFPNQMKFVQSAIKSLV